MTKLGNTLDKKLVMSSLVSGQKVDPKAKFSRLGVTNKGVFEETKKE
jgi:hypothetical protein